MFVFCSDPPQRAPAIAHVCFCPALTKRTLQSITKIVLSPSERPPDLLKEQSETYISRWSELLSIFFLRWSFIHYCSNTHEHACAHTHTYAELLFTPSTLLCPVLSFFLFTFMTQYSTVSQQEGFGFQSSEGPGPLLCDLCMCLSDSSQIIDPKLTLVVNLRVIGYLSSYCSPT